jgi:riboflavin synthase
MLRADLFTGLILEMGTVAAIHMDNKGAALSIKADTVASQAEIGDSISINGACLTVVSKKNNILSFDLSEETLKSTSLEGLKTGDKINLEPSLTPNSKIGGHFVTGHIDVAGKIRSKSKLGDMFKFEIEILKSSINFIVEKGSIAVDGISLTIVDVFKDSFTIVIIPHTAKLTTMGFKKAGDTVNIEFDILGKYVLNFLNKDNKKDSSLMEKLIEEGYIK